jgi:uncharacterized protein YbcI
MATVEQGSQPSNGQLSSAISNHVVRQFADYTGRGPTKARTVVRDTLVVCLTQDSMTKAERRLVAEGEADMVATVRRKFQQTMRDDLVSGVEQLTGRKVISFMSDHDSDTDHAAEVFVLDQAPEPVAAQGGDSQPS